MQVRTRVSLQGASARCPHPGSPSHRSPIFLLLRSSLLPPPASPRQPDRALGSVSLPFRGSPWPAGRNPSCMTQGSLLLPVTHPCSSACRCCLPAPGRVWLSGQSSWLPGLRVCSSPPVWNVAVFSLPHLHLVLPTEPRCHLCLLLHPYRPGQRPPSAHGSDLSACLPLRLGCSH